MEFGPIIWLIFCGCLGVSFLLSGIEAGLFALSRLRIRQQMRAGRSFAKLLHAYLENPENFLWTILVGNTLANLFILAWLAVLFHNLLGQRRLWFLVVFFAAAFLFYTLFALLSKMLLPIRPNRLCMLTVPSFRLIHWFLRPLVALVESVSRLLLRWSG